MKREYKPVKQTRLRRVLLNGSALGLFLVFTGCGNTRTATPVPIGNDWREFEGTWTAAGNRSSLALGSVRRASIGSFEGTLLLTGQGRPARGFRAEAIVLNDTTTGMLGRAVWTDERGEQVYSELNGEGTNAGNKITGTFTGGSGRYDGATGTYEFSWRFVLENEDGTVQGQSSGLKGRVRIDRSGQPPPTGGNKQ
jgi:hypothetical protein